MPSWAGACEHWMFARRRNGTVRVVETTATTERDRRAVLAEVEASSERFEAAVARLTEEDLRGPARLPGWTRGHVVAHLARNADSYWNLLEWARTGVEHPQYPSDEARAAGIEASAARPAAELAEELRVAAGRFASQVRTLPEPAWQVMVRARSGWAHPAWYTLNRRWQELEAHHIDLDAGYAHTDWPVAYVRWELAETLGSALVDGGLAAGRVRATDLGVDIRLGDGPEISGPGHEVLGWLTGRGDGPAPHAWPSAPPWPRPPAAWRDT